MPDAREEVKSWWMAEFCGAEHFLVATVLSARTIVQARTQASKSKRLTPSNSTLHLSLSPFLQLPCSPDLAYMENLSNIAQSPNGSEHIAVSDNTHTNISSESDAETNTPLMTTPPTTKHSATFRNRKATGDAVNRTTSPRPTGRSFSLARAANMILQPEKEVGPSPGVWQSLRSILLASWLNLLLLFIPVSWALHFAFAGEKDTVIFCGLSQMNEFGMIGGLVFLMVTFVCLISVVGGGTRAMQHFDDRMSRGIRSSSGDFTLLALATDELSLRVGKTLAGLLNASLGNTVELIVAIISLQKCELQIIQSSLVGSILNNLLLVVGMSFFAGGIKFQEQGFAQLATQLNSSLLAISVIAVLLPAALHFSVVNGTENDGTFDILSVSYGTSIILLFLYFSSLVFQLFSHASLYADENEDTSKSTRYGVKKHKAEPPIELQTSNIGTVSSATTTAVAHRPEDNYGVKNSSEEGKNQPRLSVRVTVGLLTVVTVLVGVTVEWLVDSIDGMTRNRHISKEFIGVIILPIVCRTPDGVTIVTTSVKDELDLSMSIAVGSSIQIALSVTPFIVLLGWMMGKPLTLPFDPYESVSMFLAVLTVNYVVLDGKANWLEGMILMCLYAILCVTFWFYPGNNPSGGLLMTCT
ncbi:Sodium/calcium exchanger protein-domain-containing protein [Armillaria borealis]|uniref:Vacuolar calcium ion transporter n=1 Tax=Armillaria borealis TaxID=47425 RepID=A0AA39MXC6_9AGAR|nr:Sodium/calcium exchanger protein-domain-containing protein [Armillaria borealis]